MYIYLSFLKHFSNCIHSLVRYSLRTWNINIWKKKKYEKILFVPLGGQLLGGGVCVFKLYDVHGVETRQTFFDELYFNFNAPVSSE